MRTLRLVTVALAVTIGLPGFSESPTAAVTFTFDDGQPSLFEYAFPVLRDADFPATAYVIAGKIDPQNWHLTWAQIDQLRDAGWEIGSHTMTHLNLREVPPAIAYSEMEDSRQMLWRHGIHAMSFAPPYGEVDEMTMRLIRQTYRSSRLVWGGGVDGRNGLNLSNGFDSYAISALMVTPKTELQEVENLLDTAVREKRWVVFLFHNVIPDTPEYDTQITVDMFQEIVDMVGKRRSQLAVRTIGQMVESQRR